MIKVNNTTWYIQKVAPNSFDLMRSDGCYTLGVTDNSVKTIYINRNLNDFMFEKVLTHEICHVFCFEYNLEFSIDFEEKLCDFVATYGRNIFEIVDEILQKSNLKFSWNFRYRIK